MQDDVGQLLQRRVRSHGKNARHRLFMRPRWLQGQNVRIGAMFNKNGNHSMD
jgi:hypothetical protein